MFNVQCPMSNARLFTGYLLLNSFWLFMLLGTLFGAEKVAAQTIPSCSPWVIEVTPAPVTTQIACGADGTPCNILYYYVYLYSGSNTTVDFDFYSIDILGSLAVSISSGAGTQRRISHLDKAQTLLCSPSDINSGPANTPTMSVDEINNSFGYHLQNIGTGGEELITWQVTTGRRLLFILAVNAFPGETVIPALSGAIKWKDNNTTVICEPLIVSNNPLVKSIALPTTACATTEFQMLIGSPSDDPILGYPQRKVMAVSIKNNTSANIEIKDLDFLIAINSTISTAEVSATPKIGTVTVDCYPEPSTNNTQHRVYATVSSAKVKPNTETVLFYIFVNGPALNAECGTASLFFTPYRRANYLGSCCLPPAAPLSTGTPVTISWDGGECLSCAALTVHARHSSVTPANACQDLSFDLSLSATTDKKYDQGTFVVDITHSGSLTLNTVQTVATTGINNPVFTATAISSTVLRVTFTFDQNTTPLLVSAPIPPSTSFFRQIAHLAFTGSEVCISAVYFHDATLMEENATQLCVPSHTVTDITEESAADNICLQSVAMGFVNPLTGLVVTKVNYELKAPLPSPPNSFCIQTGIVDVDGTAALCACAVASTVMQTLTPTRNDNHINGVSTFDLVLISKHVLGIEPFTSPYKMIAADANKSNSVTTFDIVELRKLVLGVYNELPNNKSFRFVLRDYVFLSPTNPWQEEFPESKTFFVGTPDANFHAIKIGDINGNVASNFMQTEDRQQTMLPLGYASPGGKRRQLIEIPVFVQQGADLTAWQMALQYNPDALKIKGIRWMNGTQDRYQSQDWNIPTSGELRLSWMDGMGTATHLNSNAPLCYVQVELLHDQSEINLRIMPAATSIASESYAANGVPASFSLLPVRDYQAPATVTPSSVDTKPLWTAMAYPNPTQGQFRLEVTLPEGGEGSITFYDAFGRSCATQSRSFAPGLNVVSSSQLPALHAGQYMVQIDTPLGRQTIRVVLLQ